MVQGIEEGIFGLLADNLSIEKEEIRLESRLIDDLGADSLDMVELVMAFEDRYDIAISDDAAEGLYTVGNVVDYITQYAKGI